MALDQARNYVMIGDIGGIAQYHVGDEAMLEANLTLLRLLIPGVTFTLVSKDPNWSSQHYGERTISYVGFPPPSKGTHDDRDALLSELLSNARRWLQTGRLSPEDAGASTIAAVAQANGVIISGGGNLCSSWPEHIYERVALSGIARILQKPVFILGQTLGPQLDGQEQQLLANEIPSARLVGVREAASASTAASLGAEPDDILPQLDDAIFLPPPSDLNRVQTLLDGFRKPWIAVTFHPFINPDENPEAMNNLARQLRAVAGTVEGHLVFVPHEAKPGQQIMSDVGFGQRLAELLRPDVEMSVLDVLQAREARYVLSQASMVVSTRYHPIVFGLSWGIPCLGIFMDKYTKIKLQGALAHAGLSSWSLPGQLALLDDMLVDSALDLWRSRQKIRGHLTSVLAQWRQTYADHWLRIYHALTPGDGSSAGLRDTVLSTVQPAGETSAAAPDSAPPQPTGTWAQMSRLAAQIVAEHQAVIAMLETELKNRQRDVSKQHEAWANERKELVSQRDTAVDYAESMEAELKNQQRDFAEQYQAWMNERQEIISQRDTAVDYAKSLEAALRAHKNKG